MQYFLKEFGNWIIYRGVCKFKYSYILIWLRKCYLSIEKATISSDL